MGRKNGRFSEPRKCTVTFKPYPDGECRKQLRIDSCVGVYADRVFSIIYLAGDGKEHRHKYQRKIIQRVTAGDELMYDADTLNYRERRFK